MSNYVKVLLTEFFTELKLEIMECYKSADISDSQLNAIIANPNGEVAGYDED